MRSLYLILLAMLLLGTLNVCAVAAYDSYEANAIWAEPSLIELSATEIAAGHRFKVTIWANSSLEARGWQFWLLYADAYLNATGAWYCLADGTGSASGPSEFMADATATIPVTPAFNSHNATHSRVEFGEAWLMGDYASPKTGRCAIVEFEVVDLPPEDVVEVWLDMKSSYELFDPPRTYILYSDGSKKPVDIYNGLVRFLGEDTTPPMITILSPQNTTYNTTSIPLTFTVTETVDWIGYSLDEKKNTTIGGNTTLSIATEGQHDIIVYANDTSGNMGISNRVYFTTVLPEFRTTDLNHDNYTGIDDIILAGEFFGSYPGHPRWNPDADINFDNHIDIVDIVLIARDFGNIWQ